MIKINKNSSYYKQVDLLLKILPYVMDNKIFALKGGTAINLFYRDLPRFSVDIDLTYVPIEPRDMTLENIHNNLTIMKQIIEKKLPRTNVTLKKSMEENVKQIVVNEGDISVKVEVNNILRGHVFPCLERELCSTAQDIFEKYLSINCLSFNDVFAGKICAALDRQHPRDLFDIKILLENEGMSENLKNAFIVYLISGNRPISEMLQPSMIGFEVMYKRELEGMILGAKISYDDLVLTRSKLIELVHANLTEQDKKFLLSFKRGEPDWSLFSISGINELPAIKWKLNNIKKLSVEKHDFLIKKLESALFSYKQ